MMVPTVEQMGDVSSWVAHIHAGGGGDVMDALNSIANVAKKAESVKNVAILISGANSMTVDAMKEAEALLKSKAHDDDDDDKNTTFAYTLLLVPGTSMEQRPQSITCI